MDQTSPHNGGLLCYCQLYLFIAVFPFYFALVNLFHSGHRREGTGVVFDINMMDDTSPLPPKNEAKISHTHVFSFCTDDVICSQNPCSTDWELGLLYQLPTNTQTGLNCKQLSIRMFHPLFVASINTSMVHKTWSKCS